VEDDDDLLIDFVMESRDHLSDMENQFLQIEQDGENINVDLVNEVFRGIHSIKGAAGFLGLTKVNDLSHNLENLLNMMRNEELVPTSAIVDVMLRATDTLRNMILDVKNSNDVDVSAHVTELEAVEAAAAAAAETPTPSEESDPAPSAPEAAAVPVVSEPVPEVVEEAPVEVAAAPAKVAEKKSDAKSAPAVQGEANIRVSVGVLDSLMNLAGELVLSRNQLLQVISKSETGGMEGIAARLDQVTSELQEAIMQTRMQPIGSVFGKFPRVVRDLSAKLSKQCDLVVEGKDVEVDKTIIEAIGDPLTHLVRNSVDHGLELPEKRQANGKKATGTIYLRACYQAGKVRIEIEDDGGGIDPAILKEKAVSKGVITAESAESMTDREAVRLIFAPGFSTAKEVTSVSGRGVGMDVVRTNITKLGGTVDVESTIGKGTNIIVTLPLTLAIIPSLIVQVGADRFAIPQVNIVELVRVTEAERSARFSQVKNAEVLRLRGSLLPLVRLNDSLHVGSDDSFEKSDKTTDAINIIVVDTGQARFGLVVNALHDSEEIVVKPLGQHFKDCRCMAGATILGDGHVALILDIAGIAAEENIRSAEELDAANGTADDANKDNEDQQAVLLFQTSENDRFAVPMDLIARIERVRSDQIDSVGGLEVLQYKQSTLPLLRVNDHVTGKSADDLSRVYVVVFEVNDREIGLLAPVLDDIRMVSTLVDTVTFREPGVIGSQVIDGHTTRLIDLFELTEAAHPHWFEDREAVVSEKEGAPPHILLAEDSGFFRNQVVKILESTGYLVEPCEDGQIAWDKLKSGQYDFDLIVTDIEMPNMNGFELCRHAKDDARFREIPVIALTSLAAAADLQHGIDVGIDDYQIKMDREKLLNSIRNFVDHTKAASTQRKTKTSQRQTQKLVGSH